MPLGLVPRVRTQDQGWPFQEVHHCDTHVMVAYREKNVRRYTDLTTKLLKEMVAPEDLIVVFIDAVHVMDKSVASAVIVAVRATKIIMAALFLTVNAAVASVTIVVVVAMFVTLLRSSDCRGHAHRARCDHV